MPARSAPPDGRRLLLVHAHPDDETITCGLTMARYGTAVTLVTCTLGEEGEVVAADLAWLTAAGGDALAAHRSGELARACVALGVTDHRILGGAGRFRDSGMAGTAAAEHPRGFARAPGTETVPLLVSIIREVRPQVVVTYDENGGYGHPDHIAAHRVTTAALPASADAGYRPDLGPPFAVSRLYYPVLPERRYAAALARLAAASPPYAGLIELADEATSPDRLVAVALRAPGLLPAKRAALGAHRSQLRVERAAFRLADGAARPILPTEYFRLGRGERPAGSGDLFAGLAG